MAEERMERFKAEVEPQLRSLYRAALRLTGNRADAEDLVQETCLQAWQQIPAQIDGAHLRNWLLRALYHRFVDGVRRRQRGPVEPMDSAEDPTPGLMSPDPGPDELAELDDDERVLHGAWLRLEPVQRALLALRAEGFGLAEIEAITAIGREVLRARLHRARRSLAQHLVEARSHTPTRVGRAR